MSKAPEFGNALHESVVKKALQELNPGFHFDMGAALNLWHPRITEWQGVFVDGRHVSTLQRGTCPEFTIYKVREQPDPQGRMVKVRGEVLFIGWRNTLERIVRERVNGVTWESLCGKLDIDRKVFTGDPRELEVA
jgi:hypothetical protein